MKNNSLTTLNIKWSYTDIIDRAEENGLTISRKQAKEILFLLNHNYDCNTGINWDVIDVQTTIYLDDPLANSTDIIVGCRN